MFLHWSILGLSLVFVMQLREKQKAVYVTCKDAASGKSKSMTIYGAEWQKVIQRVTECFQSANHDRGNEAGKDTSKVSSASPTGNSKVA